MLLSGCLSSPERTRLIETHSLRSLLEKDIFPSAMVYENITPLLENSISYKENPEGFWNRYFHDFHIQGGCMRFAEAYANDNLMSMPTGFSEQRCLRSFQEGQTGVGLLTTIDENNLHLVTPPVFASASYHSEKITNMSQNCAAFVYSLLTGEDLKGQILSHTMIDFLDKKTTRISDNIDASAVKKADPSLMIMLTRFSDAPADFHVSMIFSPAKISSSSLNDLRSDDSIEISKLGIRGATVLTSEAVSHIAYGDMTDPTIQKYFWVINI